MLWSVFARLPDWQAFAGYVAQLQVGRGGGWCQSQCSMVQACVDVETAWRPRMSCAISSAVQASSELLAATQAYDAGTLPPSWPDPEPGGGGRQPGDGAAWESEQQQALRPRGRGGAGSRGGARALKASQQPPPAAASGYVGVQWMGNKWTASICLANRQASVFWHSDPALAAVARDCAVFFKTHICGAGGRRQPPAMLHDR